MPPYFKMLMCIGVIMKRVNGGDFKSYNEHIYCVSVFQCGITYSLFYSYVTFLQCHIPWEDIARQMQMEFE